MKALVQEVVANFTQRLTEAFGLVVRELSGDVSLSKEGKAKANCFSVASPVTYPSLQSFSIFLSFHSHSVLFSQSVSSLSGSLFALALDPCAHSALSGLLSLLPSVLYWRSGLYGVGAHLRLKLLLVFTAKR